MIHLGEQRLTTPWQQRAFTKLLGLQYRITYKKGVDNRATDALSRVTPLETAMVVTSVQPAWLDDILASYNANPQAQRLLEQLAIRPDPKGRFSLVQGILRFRGAYLAGRQHILTAADHRSVS